MRELVAACGIWLLPGGVITLWLLGLGALLLLAATPVRHLAGGALRVFSIAVAGHALLALSAIRHAADLSAQHRNPSDALGAAGAALVASGLVAVFGCWLGRSWTPTAQRRPALPAAIDWNREGPPAVITVLVALVLLIVLGLTAQWWVLLLIIVVLLFNHNLALSWSAQSLQVGFALLAVLALAVYAWLSLGKRGALRAPLQPRVALPLGLLCCLLGAGSMFVKGSPIRPSWAVMHDGALLERLLESAARDEGELFESARRELVRRHGSEHTKRVESTARELRRVAAGPASLSARLVAHYEAQPPRHTSSEDYLGGDHFYSLVGGGAPELAVADVLLARGETREVLAWIADAGVPLGMRLEIAKHWSQLPSLPRPVLIAALGRACVDAQKHGTPPDVPQFSSHSTCDLAIDRLLPRDQRQLTASQGFALGYALIAVGGAFIDERLALTTNDDVAVAMLRGMRAAELSDPNRAHAIETRILKCDRLEQLAALVCPGDRASICGTEAARFAPIPPEILEHCLAQLALETSPELVSFGGY